MRNLVLSLCLCLFSVAQCARILGVFPLGGKSHHTAGVTLMKILVEKGHDVTMVSPLSAKKLPKNFREIVLSAENEKEVDFFSYKCNSYLQSYIYNSIGPAIVNATLTHPVFKKFLSANEKFDVIILEQFYSDGLKYLGIHFKAPLILYSAMDSSFMTNPTVGNPAPPSYIPDTITPYTSDMTFFQRMDNFFMQIFNLLISHFIFLPAHDRIVKESMPGAPDITEYVHNPAIVLLNGDVSISNPVPKVPAMIDIGGFHIKPSKPLPEDLQSIMDKAKHGVIFFSLGSNIKSSSLPKETLNILLKVFSSLKETVLWKWEDEHLPGKPDNVIIRNWLPQNDLFAHKNVKLFITHGGIFSTLEAVYHGIPCLAIPIFGDQYLNAKRAASNGYARWVELKTMTEAELRAEIQELLTNPKYSENAKKRSLILKDKPRTPADTLAFWVDYVIRHNGADHFRIAALKLSWYQYIMLDVITFIAACLILIIIALKYSIRQVIKLFKKSDSKKKTN